MVAAASPVLTVPMDSVFDGPAGPTSPFKPFAPPCNSISINVSATIALV